jgi:STE24 endopeptidase
MNDFLGNIYLNSLLLLISGGFLLETLSDLLNLTRLNDPLPNEFEGIFDPEKYAQSLSYQKSNTYFDLIQRSFFYLVTITFILSAGFGKVDDLIKGFGWGPLARGLGFFGVLIGLRFILGLPFMIYNTFVLEERYGFNRTTPNVFVGDLIKGLLLTILIGIPIYYGITFFFENSGQHGWLVAWLAFTLFQILLMYLAPAVIMPLFNKFTPLPEGPIRDAIQVYAKKMNFQLSGIFTMDSSKRSTKSNAFFTGFGKFRRLVLFDSLIEKQNTEELVAIFAHEVGHYARKHIVKGIALSLLPTAAMFYAVALVLNNEDLFKAFSMEGPSIYAGLVFVGLFFGPVSQVLSIFTQALSRKHEYEADHFSVETQGHPEHLISALKKLSRDNLSHLTPHPLKVLLEYTHPPILERIRALKH